MKTLIVALFVSSSAHAIDYGFEVGRSEMEFKAMVNTKGFRTGYNCFELFTQEIEAAFSAAGLPLPAIDTIPGTGFNPAVAWPY